MAWRSHSRSMKMRETFLCLQMIATVVLAAEAYLLSRSMAELNARTAAAPTILAELALRDRCAQSVWPEIPRDCLEMEIYLPTRRAARGTGADP